MLKVMARDMFFPGAVDVKVIDKFRVIAECMVKDISTDVSGGLHEDEVTGKISVRSVSQVTSGK